MVYRVIIMIDNKVMILLTTNINDYFCPSSTVCTLGIAMITSRKRW